MNNELPPELIIGLYLSSLKPPLLRALEPWLRQKRCLRLLAAQPEALAIVPELADLFDDQKKITEYARLVEQWGEVGVKVCAIGEEGYPYCLQQIPQPPPVLFYSGASLAGLEQQPTVAIVGSRKASSEGCGHAQRLARELREFGVCIVSGLALGIDSAAHRGALERATFEVIGFHPGGEIPTIAVLGQGLPETYPPSNRALAQQILRGGGTLVSHFPPYTQPYPSNFLDRNRLISGLAQGVLVIEAPIRSGSLNTANHALEQGRDLMAVPGSISDPRNGGSNRLIQQGAQLVSCVSDIVELIPTLQGVAANADRSRTKAQKSAVLERLFQGAASISLDQLHFKIQNKIISQGELLELELSGQIVRGAGNELRRASC